MTTGPLFEDLLEHVFAASIELDYTPAGLSKSVQLVVSFLAAHCNSSSEEEEAGFFVVARQTLEAFLRAFNRHMASPAWVQPYGSVHFVSAAWGLARSFDRLLRSSRKRGDPSFDFDDDDECSDALFAAVAERAKSSAGSEKRFDSVEGAVDAFYSAVHAVFARSVAAACDALLRKNVFDKDDFGTGVVEVLSSLWECMHVCSLPCFLRRQYYAQLLRFVCAVLFNRLVSDDDGGSSSCAVCTCNEGVRLRLGLAAIEEWLKSDAHDVADAVRSLSPVRDAATLLVMQRKSEVLLDDQAFTSLNPAQLSALLSHCSPAPPDLPELLSAISAKVLPDMPVRIE